MCACAQELLEARKFFEKQGEGAPTLTQGPAGRMELADFGALVRRAHGPPVLGGLPVGVLSPVRSPHLPLTMERRVHGRNATSPRGLGPPSRTRLPARSPTSGREFCPVQDEHQNHNVGRTSRF